MPSLCQYRVEGYRELISEPSALQAVRRIGAQRPLCEQIARGAERGTCFARVNRSDDPDEIRKVDALDGRAIDHGEMTRTTNADETSPLTEGAKPGYAIAFLAAVPDSQELQEHMAGIESTISSFGGRWLAHGSPPEVREGLWRGDVAIIAFPDIARARAWHESKEYQDIARRRTENTTSWIALVEGVAPRAADTSEAVGHEFLPGGFDPPTSLKTERFRLEPLGPQHNEADLAAWMSSIDHIRATPGYPDGNWPPRDGMTPERNMRDLRRHADDFASRKGFTFTVLDPDVNDVIGCVYLYPAQAANHDVEVQSWVRADRADLDGRLAETIRRWIETDWPWKRVDYLDR